MDEVQIDSRQRALQPIDGCSENTFKLDYALKYHRQNFREMFLVSLDVAKAFDTVSHKALIDTMESNMFMKGARFGSG